MEAPRRRGHITGRTGMSWLQARIRTVRVDEAVVVADPRVGAFIDMLAQLVTDPARFRNEPRLDDAPASPCWAPPSRPYSSRP